MKSKARLALCATAGQDPDRLDTRALAVYETSLLAAMRQTREALTAFDPTGADDTLSASVKTLMSLLSESARLYDLGVQAGRQDGLDWVEATARVCYEQGLVRGTEASHDTEEPSQASARPVLRLVKSGGVA